MEQFHRPNKAYINLDNIIHNLKMIRSMSSSSKIMGVVKANAYGHGAVMVSKILVESGVDYLAVADLHEAIELRKENIEVPILIFAYCPSVLISTLVEYGITPTVTNYDFAFNLSEVAKKYDKVVPIHYKVDTGMARLGKFYDGNINKELVIEEIKKISELQNVYIEGLYTQSSCADKSVVDSVEYTKLQFDRFINLVEKLSSLGLKIPLKHFCNSAAFFHNKDYHLDMIRPGISLYGLCPSVEFKDKMSAFLPAMSIKSVVSNTKYVPCGVGVSYDKYVTTKCTSFIGVFPMGYADGLSEPLSNRGKVIIPKLKEYAKIVGKICMDQTIIDLTGKENIGLEDEIIVLGSHEDKSITASDIAELMGVSVYELVCKIGSRVTRIYTKK